MPQSFGVYGEQKKDVQPWSQTITLFPGSQNVSNFFSLYSSQGDVTLTGANTIPTLLDGPEKVVRYGNLTLGDGTTVTSLTASNRCKGLAILCDSLTVKANASLNMTGKGPRVIVNDDPFFPFVDFKIPFKIALDSSQTSLAQALAVLKDQGLAPWDRGTFHTTIASLFGFNLGITLDGSLSLMLTTGCAAGAAGQTTPQPGNLNGSTGNAGANGGTGSGGHGGLCGRMDISGYPAWHGQSGAGNPYGGGNATSGLSAGNGYGSIGDQIIMPMMYAFKVGTAVGAGSGGAGVGAGAAGTAPWGGTNYPGSEGVGGKLVVICKGAVTVLSGGKIEANGMPGGGAAGVTYGTGGGGSGGGHVSIISSIYPVNSGTIQSAGGAGGAGPYGAGGAGGAGSVVTKTFIEMGW